MAETEDAIEDLADLYVARRIARGASKRYIERVAARRARSTRGGISKALAARLLGISVNTLDKWIGRERIRTVKSAGSRREMVDVDHLVELLVHVRLLRALGQRNGVLAAAISEMEREDRTFNKQFDDLYGSALTAVASDDLKPLELPGNFGPDD
jgi:hypothetical protein